MIAKMFWLIAPYLMFILPIIGYLVWEEQIAPRLNNRSKK